ncbi:Stk1 family PASTA domain-containing Ser/Thr kinase [Auraticoccus sp. F435]|uniref:non-specific serine/threonine protein kinase n=1 Tax=Auraticoccus cholistanensis TaxID=2656650 RepID=A0A6A9UT84_9ACTN|nr:Stk1 family PASTA domain-containing Ser/Thr kinase [Auraticoccus cholistanensis]MVA74784.1 Stk1 family PASTA domain-containing Ser/Thr kinase [Auraticoccus cholistanensis]
MTLLGDRYELGDPLGRGGMADVRRATDTRLNRQVAVKRLRADLAADPTFQARFRREAQSAAGLNHPNIVAVYDTGEDFDERAGVAVPYIVMELVEGSTLRDVLRDGRKIMPERALEIMQGVLEALSYSHRAGIVHRDIKPANVMLTPNGTIKVMDFGIARAVADTSATMTQTAAVIGTAQYLSPEQARGETVDARSDIYSAGCLLYELLVGRPPFIGDSPVSVAYQHVREQPTPPSQLDPVITPAIDAVVLTALAKDPEARYQSAREFSDDLGRLLAGEELTTVLPAAAAMPAADNAATQLLGGTPTPVPVGGLTPGSAGSADDQLPVGQMSEEEDEPTRKGPWILIAVLALLVIAGAVAGAIWLLDGSGRAQDDPSAAPSVQLVTVPDVFDRTEADAREAVEALGLELEVDRVNGEDDETVGRVTNQDPSPNEQVQPDSTVTVEVNMGPAEAQIPSNLVGQSLDEARDALREAGFEDVKVEEATNEPPDAQAEEVLEVTPAEGSEAPLETEVTLVVATGESELPDWSGLNRAGVQQNAEQLGFTDVQFEDRESDEVDPGLVVGTDPEAGTTIDRDDRVVVYLATEPEEPEPSQSAPAPSATPGATPDEDEDSPSPSASQSPR